MKHEKNTEVTPEDQALIDQAQQAHEYDRIVNLKEEAADEWAYKNRQGHGCECHCLACSY